MYWEKIGKIFDPSACRLPKHCTEFAQAPQALVFDDFVRIYFSTREKDATGKYLSHVAFADFNKKFELLRVSDQPVIPLGALGCYDEHGIFPLNVLRVQDRVLGYIGGWSRRVSVSVDGAIGVASSIDGGLTFQRMADGPVLAASVNEPFLIGDPFVLQIDGLFHMWYIFGTRWTRASPDGAPERVYKIGHAVSTDGLQWDKPTEGVQIVADSLGPDESQALPTVAKIGSTYHMYFCYRQSLDFRLNRNRGYRIGHAVSTDLLHWQRCDADVGIDVTDADWDSDMLCYPHVFQMDGDHYMLYNGNAFGRFGFGVAKLRGSLK